MKKEDLMKIDGMTDSIAEAVTKLHADEISGAYVPKSRFDEVNEAKKNAESLVKERDEQLEEVKKSAGDNEELKKQIETLQADNKQAKADYESAIKKMQIDNAVRSALMGAGAKNVTAATALLKDLDKAELLEDGTVKGLSEQIKELVKSDSYLFNTSEGGKPSGATPAGSNKDVPGGITKEQFDRMGYDQRLELFNTNRELYNSFTQN